MPILSFNFSSFFIMSRQRTLEASAARRNSSKPPPQAVTAEEMVAVSYYNGVRFADVKSFINMINRNTQSRATFFRKQAKAEEKIIQCENKLTADSREKFSGNFSIDRRWSNLKFGLHGTVMTVDPINHEVLEFSTWTKEVKNSVSGDYKGSSNIMETVGTSNVLHKLQDHKILQNTKTICKDRDNHSLKVYVEMKCQHLIVNDLNHSRKSFKRAVDKLVKDYQHFCYIDVNKEEVAIEKPFDDLSDHLI